MSLPPLSPTQQRAVNHAFEDALVTAGAGSGKTRVLTERYVRLVREHDLSVRRLAALTFTDKAAAQMRERIADLLEEAGDERARADVEFAPISTIHSFCSLLLRLHAVEAGLDPAFQILDAAEASLLRADAAEAAERRLVQVAPEVLQAFALLPATDPRGDLLGLLERIRGAGGDVAALTWQRGEPGVAAARAAVPAALEDLAAQSGLVPAAHQPAMARALTLGRAAAVEGENAGSLEPFVVWQAAGAVGDLKVSRKAPFISARREAVARLEALAGALLDDWGSQRLLPALRTALGAYEEAYDALKRERAALDFTDLELRALQLLERLAERGRRADLAPRALLVDEYQDTNPLQARILEHLRGAAPQFAVGDPKQSIYRFRRADVGVIVRERERVGTAGRHAMNDSYRACPELVAALNGLHERLFADGNAGVEYEPLAAKGAFDAATGPVFDICLVDAGGGVNADEARAAEADWIACWIRDLVAAGIPRLAVSDAEDGGGPLGYGDCAVLFRARTSLAIYEEAFDRRGVPFLTQKGSGYFLAEEIADLLDVLRVIHNPADEHALACFVTGPAVGAGDADLLRWFGHGGEAAWERMRAEAAAGGSCREQVRTLEALRLEAVNGSLARTVERALADLGLLEAALLRPAGDRRAANLRKAVEIARRLDRGGRRGLGDLLRHLSTLRDQGVGESEAPVGGEGDDVVRLSTVHGAKGLEYPVVVLADLSRQIPHRPAGLLYDGAGGLAARINDPLEGESRASAGHAALAADDAMLDAQESLRLLYVATTRAKERLLLTGWCQGATKDGRPKGVRGWGRLVWSVLGLPFESGCEEVALGRGRIRVTVTDEMPVPRAGLAARAPGLHASDDDEARRADALLEAAARPTAPLGDTRFVVSVSELLTFADSPRRYYEECVLRAGTAAIGGTLRAEPDDPASGVHVEEPETGRRQERLAAWDEADPGAGEGSDLDRAALGRIVHAILERLTAEDAEVPADLLDAALAEEHPVSEPAGLRAAVRAMVDRFIGSDIGRLMRAGLADGADVRREVALHARIRFPGGKPVAGFDALLVKGSIDLWLPVNDGIWLVDHKTNRPSAGLPTPEAIAERYAWQLRLYALAAERVLGTDVAGARLLLLDPGWGPEAVALDVDIAGPSLEETRRLCMAFALAELQGRYPEDWQNLLSEPAGMG